MNTKKVKPVKAIIVDPKQAALHKIDVDIDRLGKQIAEKNTALEADTKLHPLDQSQPLQERLKTQISELRGHVDRLHKERFDIELGDLAPKAPGAAPQGHSKKKWDIKNVPEPTYPAGARQRGDKAALDRAFLAFVEYNIDQAKIAMQRRDVDAAGRASIELLMDVAGEHLGMHVWMSERVKELETRVAELESKPSVEYRGVWKADEAYKRGHLCTHDGSMWHAEVGSQGLLPGQGAAWKLCVKKGRDARS
ncbi:hypothetical protein EN852_009735 [Mesorhizobium sp. M2E.F.Ca.ET.209.01.1.1]|uniref:hypothetical protein n=1 Tax=Mesorhizobium sp. M2E.F.Ca.ET.209.01.1.1 TaxID=2500526 RepID=UPI000FD9F2EE|nr:hypothetical protein [Mesorhizobium sp. M2E.F.Ca.ET.209.01.1.1]TGS15904.1 hypothetical protein EN852_009735 [Mesorhizobium sp. M2E.F.Ca.ET.209.01.1.1]